MMRFLNALFFFTIPLFSFAGSYQDLLVKALEEKNQHLPRMLNDKIRLDSIRLSGKNIVSYYTIFGPILTAKDKEFQFKEKMLQSTCQTDDLQVVLRLGYQLRHLVFSDQGKQLLNIVINRYDCIGAYKDYAPNPIWAEIAATKSATFFADVRSIDKVNRRSFITIRTEYKNHPQYKNNETEVSFLCEENTYRIQSVKSFDENGNLLAKNENADKNWKKVSADNTPIGMAYRLTCDLIED